MGKAHKLVDHIQMKRVIKIMVLIILFPVITFAQLPDTLTKYFTPVSLQNPDSAWNVLKPALKGKKLFLFGEAHGVACNKPLQLSLLKFLHKNARVRHLLLEVSPSEGFLYDWYLKVGDDRYLSNNGYAVNKEEQELWQSLFRFNQKLPKKDKIRVFGIDYYNENAFLQAMVTLFWDRDTTKVLPKELLRVDNMLEKTVKQSNGHQKLYKTISKVFKKYRKAFEDNLEDDFWYFCYIMENQLFKRKDKKRDRKMFQNMAKILLNFNSETFLGIFGQNHTLRDNKVRNISYFQNKDHQTNQIKKPSALIINTHYLNSYFWLDKEPFFSESIGVLNDYDNKYVSYLDKYSKQNITLIKFSKALITNKLLRNSSDFLLLFKKQQAESKRLTGKTSSGNGNKD